MHKRYLVLFCCWLGLTFPARAAQMICDPYISPVQYITYGQTAFVARDYGYARYAFACAAELDDGNIAARKWLALVYAKQGDMDTARQIIREITP